MEVPGGQPIRPCRFESPTRGHSSWLAGKIVVMDINQAETSIQASQEQTKPMAARN